MSAPSDFLADGYVLEPHGDGVELRGERWADETICDINALQNAFVLLSDPDMPLHPGSWTRAYVENRTPTDALGMALVRDPGGSPVGAVWMQGSRDDNTHLMFGDISVLPDHRGRRLATAMLAHFAAFAVKDHRSTLLLGSDNVQEPAEAFATSLGAAVGLRAHVNQLQLTDLPAGLIERWLTDDASDDYELVWLDGPTPDDAIPDLIALREVLLNTAPMDDVPLDDRVVTEVVIRSDDERTTASGDVRWLLFARHRATAAAVAYTEVFVSDHRSKIISQGATAVDPGHRGHGLGRWMKAAMTERIVRERPECKVIRTFNADSNTHMLAINNAMGFRPHKAGARWVLSVDDAHEWLEKRR